MTKRLSQLAVALVLPVCGISAAQALPITIINADPAGEGFNDQRPVNPVGGNTATTLGAQRLAVLEAAADLLGAQLDGPVPLVVKVRSSNSLRCTDSSAVIANGGSTFVFRNFPGATVADTFYPVGLANQLAGFDLIPADNAAGNDPSDITITLNRRLGQDGCLSRSTVYYGLDDSPPPASINLLGVATHELIHGFGFSSGMNPRNGDFSIGAPSIYDQLIRVNDDAFSSDRFVDLTSAERLMAATNGANDELFLGSKNAVRGKTELLVNRGESSAGPGLYTPEKIQPGSSVSHWTTSLVPNQLMEPTATFDQRPTQQLGLATCALADLGWTLAASAACPDGQNDKALTFGERYIDFGTIRPGRFTFRRLDVYSTSGAPVRITDIKTAGVNYAVSQSNCIGTVQLNAPCTARVNFDAVEPGIYRSTLTVTYENGQQISTQLVGQKSDADGNVPNRTAVAASANG
ncbi:hypothetical protein [Salinisphaera japonica]|uniref:Peptidase n=1 Tax=Salinisphaera japonica YTM-1 TaxID=1209778 RepID=A0A423PK19_9GAMM|nr:hypothetical protein [Salinisphaera japonica]ROO25950.1 peptidase [Salinisphaera japonica YTM-1]